ncbi:hypothetical protein JW992_03075 [candidate division KSB1 bacterium]|nr:hypothetical protein [candidate division KSB1 bacterium]
MMTEQPERPSKVLDVTVLIQHRWLIVRNAAITAILVALVSIFIPPKYIAIATLMPQSEQMRSGMSNVFSEMAVPGLKIPVQAPTSELFVEILKSRTLNSRVLARKFKVQNDSLSLYRYLKYPSIEIGLYKFSDVVAFNVSSQGLISIVVTLSNPQLAADVANAFVEELDRVNREKSVSRAKSSRIYIEEQLAETEGKLAAAAEQLARYQQQHRTVALEDQTRASIEQAGDLKGRILAQEIHIGVLLKSMRPENPVVVQAQRELEALEQRYQEIQKSDSSKADFLDLFPPISDLPQVGVDLALLMRDVRAQQTVWELLNQQYYQAKIEEARTTPTVQILDPAVPPPIASSPRKKHLVMVMTGLCIVLNILFIIGKNAFKNALEKPEQNPLFVFFVQALNKDIDRIKRLFHK